MEAVHGFGFLAGPLPCVSCCPVPGQAVALLRALKQGAQWGGNYMEAETMGMLTLKWRYKATAVWRELSLQ